MKILKSKTMKKTYIATTVLLSSFATFADSDVAAQSTNPYLTYIESAQNAFKDYAITQFTQYINISLGISEESILSAKIDNPIITDDGDLSFSLIYTFDDDMQIITSYLVKPVQKKVDGINAIATYTAKITNTVGLDDESIVDFLNTLQLHSEGFLTADGNIYETTKNKAPYKKNGFDLPTILNKSNTESAMSLASDHYSIPKFEYTKNDIKSISLQNLAINYEHKPADNIYYSLLGDSSISLDSGNFILENRTVKIDQFSIQSSGKLNENDLVDNSSKVKFDGDVNLPDYKYKIDLNANFALTNIDNDAYNQYIQALLNDSLVASIDKTKSALKLLEKGAGFSITDFKLKVNDKVATANIIANMAPTKIVALQNPTHLLKAVNNLTLSVDVSIDHDILTTMMDISESDLDQAITQAENQLTQIGLGDAISDNGSTVKIQFSIKQGNVYIGDELKMPLINLFMNFF